MPFVLDARLRSSSRPLAQLPLCEVRLQDDARFAWIVLTPRRADLVELADLTPPDQTQLWMEMEAAGRAVRAVGAALERPVFKLNHGQLGNVVAQLHMHIVGRRPDDGAWPGPVWGCGSPQPYSPEELDRALSAARAAF